MAARKTSKTKPVKKTSFYLYKWGNGYTTFLIADSPEEAMNKIKGGRDSVCPPEVRGERLSKKRLSEASQDFILTVSSSQPDEEDYMDDVEQPAPKKDWN